MLDSKASTEEPTPEEDPLTPEMHVRNNFLTALPLWSDVILTKTDRKGEHRMEVVHDRIFVRKKQPTVFYFIAPSGVRTQMWSDDPNWDVEGNRKVE